MKTTEEEREEAKEQNAKEVGEMMEELGYSQSEEEEEEESKTTEEPKSEEKEEPKGEEPKDEEEDEGSDDKDEVIKQLREEIASYKTGEAFKGKEETTETKSEEEPEEKETTEEKKERLKQFITPEEFDEIQTDPNKLNEVLARVAEESSTAAYERALRDIPQVVEATTKRQQTIRDAIGTFYESNPDLKDYGAYIGQIGNKIRSENPEMPIEEVLDKAGEQLRSDFKIEKAAKETEEQERKKESQKTKNEEEESPAFVTKGTGKRSGGGEDTRSDFEKQADEMMNSSTYR